MQNSELEKLIEKQPKKKISVIDFVFSNPYFVRSTEYSSIIENYSEEIVFTNKDSNIFFYVIFVFITVIFGFRAIEDISNLYYVLGLLLFLTIFFWYNKTRKLEEIKISEDGIVIEKTQYFWNQIFDYGFTIVPKHKTSDYYLEIFTMTGVKLSFGLYNYSNLDGIIETMNFFRNRYNSKRN